MAQKRLGLHTVKLENPPSIISTYSIVGPKEGEGPLGKYFDSILEDEFWGEKTWEKTETKIQRECVTNCINKVKLSFDDINYLLAGDLINQCTPSTFGNRETNIPFLRIIWSLLYFY